MKVALYFPPEYPDQPFCKFATDLYGVEFLFNSCDDTVDIIYCATVSQLLHALTAKKIYNKHVICNVHDIPYCFPEYQDTVRAWTAMLRDCDVVVSASDWTRKILQEKFNILSTTMYGYVNFPVIDQIQTKNINSGRVVQVSRYTPYKRFHLSILAFGGLKDVELLFIGPNSDTTPYVNSLREMAKPYKNITFMHSILWEDVIKEIKQSAVLISPSVFEGWGMTPIEALRSSTPVVLNNIEVFREIHGDNVVYHSYDNVNSIRNQTLQVLADTDLRNSIVTKGKENTQKFSPVEYTHRWYSFVSGYIERGKE